MKKSFFAALLFLSVFCVEAAAQQVKVDNVYYSIGNDPKYGKVAVIDSCRRKAHLGLELILPQTVEIGGRSYPLKDVRNLHGVSANKVVIPASVEVIKANAFENATAMEIVISSSVTRIEDRAFYHLRFLSSIRIPNTVRYLGDELFARSARLTNVTLPKAVEHIGKGLFAECENIHDVVFPVNMRELPERTFYACRRILNIESFKMQGATRIGKSAFENSGLLAIKVPLTIKSIGDGAFRGCAKLMSVIMPEGLVSIGSEAFADCPNLNLVQFKGQSPVKIASGTFARSKNEDKHIRAATKSTAGSSANAAANQSVPARTTPARETVSAGGSQQNSGNQQKGSSQQQGVSQQNRTVQPGTPNAAAGKYTAVQISKVMTFRGPLIQFLGKPLEKCYSGTLDGSWTYPPHTKTEAAQNKWNDERIARQEGDETLSNARLAREIKAAQEWIAGQDRIGGPVREFMHSIPNRLDMELCSRANAVSNYVAAYLELLDSDGETARTVEIRMDRLAKALRNPLYQRAIATSMEALEPYLSDDARDFFRSRGSLANAHKAERLIWPGNAK